MVTLKNLNQGFAALIEVAEPDASSPLSENGWNVDESMKGNKLVS